MISPGAHPYYHQQSPAIQASNAHQTALLLFFLKNFILLYSYLSDWGVDKLKKMYYISSGVKMCTEINYKECEIWAR
jgi:hypothetical protein